ncbi:HK97-gp10 family putative phage morphogenesis protein [Lactococcus muris]|uniref:HK97-gp10 family putative phage morphogenesis protein n=1 Tax=Lactococcus muris TaxID=2941330 RepID=A0ABV4DE89_9LACT
MKTSLSFKGIDQLVKHLDKAASLSDVQKVVKSNGAQLNKKMQVAAPVDTGYLKRSINMSLEDGGFSAKVGPTANYAPYLEYGTRFQNAQPFVKPSFNIQKNIFKNDLERLIK